MLQGLFHAAVAAGAGPTWASYDVDAAFMHVERHERGIHALWLGVRVTDARFYARTAAPPKSPSSIAL
jgi:hypothetical protein